jgi:hypothetical protein
VSTSSPISSPPAGKRSEILFPAFFRCAGSDEVLVSRVKKNPLLFFALRNQEGKRVPSSLFRISGIYQTRADLLSELLNAQPEAPKVKVKPLIYR